MMVFQQQCGQVTFSADPQNRVEQCVVVVVVFEFSMTSEKQSYVAQKSGE